MLQAYLRAKSIYYRTTLKQYWSLPCSCMPQACVTALCSMRFEGGSTACFPEDSRRFSLRAFLSYEDQACVASCLFQFLSLFHAYPKTLALEQRLGFPHLTRGPLLHRPRRHLTIGPPLGAT